MTNQLIKNSAFTFRNNGIYTQYLIPSEHSPIEPKEICGCWLLAFNTTQLLADWETVYETFKKAINSNAALAATVKLQEVHRLDEQSICLNRGFNEAYTTNSYAEYLEDGNCQPNEWIIRDIKKLESALAQLLTGNPGLPLTVRLHLGSNCLIKLQQVDNAPNQDHTMIFR